MYQHEPHLSDFPRGMLCCLDKKYPEAEQLLRQSMELRIKMFGADHKDTLSCKFWLASTLFHEKKYFEAEQLFSQLVSQEKRTLGVNHTSTLASKNWLGRTLHEQKKYAEALKLWLELIPQEMGELGPDHKDILSSWYWLGKTLYEMQKYAEAEKLLRDLLKRQERVLGANDSCTLASKELLSKILLRRLPWKKGLTYGEVFQRIFGGTPPTGSALASMEIPPTSSFADMIVAKYVTKEALTEAVSVVPTGASANKGHLQKAAPTKTPVTLADTVVRGESSSATICAKEPDLLKEAFAMQVLSPRISPEKTIKEPAVPTEVVANNHVFQEETPTKSQVASISRLEDTVQSRLSNFFADNSQRQTVYTDSEIQRVSTLLSHFNEQWSKVPRTYIVLRTIGCLNLLDTFVDLGYSDHWFPITERSLPPCLHPSKRSQFVAAQNLIMSKSLDLEKGRHCFFRKDDRLPLEVKEILGAGAYGQVHRVVSSISFQGYALKRVPRSTVFGGRGTEFIKQFIAEIQVLKRIKHDHVVEFVGSYTDPKHMGLLVLPVADMDLSTYLERAEITKHQELRTFFGCLARALEFLHEQKIRHKDIKPSNILVHGGKVLYTDFGLAFDFTDKDGSTTASMVNGRTAKYCAPEVADCESRNTSSDIWSLGVVFLEMVAVLKGRTVGYMYDFLKMHGTGQAFVRTNPPATAALITELQATGSPVDNAVLGWVQDMIMLQQKLRPTAASLIGFIISEGQNRGGKEAFCGICCVSHDDLLDDLDELEIADTN